jgi:glycosyltransferase involved in cell wall biosynthesis
MLEDKHKGPINFRASGAKSASLHADGSLTEALGIKIASTQEQVTAKASGKPLVSVIIPTYNRSWSLGKTIRSVFDQTYRPLECIIVDDGSVDDTSDLVEKLAHECPEGVDVRYFKQDNGGPNSARNRGLLECRGDFICYLDSDDLLTYNSINERADVLIADPDVDFCYGLCSVRDEHNREIGKMNESWPPSGDARISRYLFDTNAPLIRRSTCARVGLWRADDLYGQEYEYFARLKYFSNKIHFINKTVSMYIRHKRESIFDKSLPFSLALFRILLAVKALVVYGKHDNVQERHELATAFRKVAKQLFHYRDYANARTALQESLILRRSLKVFAQWLAITLMAIWNRKTSSS